MTTDNTGNAVTVGRDEFQAFREDVIQKLEDLKKQINFLIDPQKGLFLSVHDNTSRTKQSEEKIDNLEKKIEGLEKFKTQTVTILAVVQVVAVSIGTLLGILL